MKPKEAQLLRVRVNLGVIEMMKYSTFLRVPELEPHHQMQFTDPGNSFFVWWGGSLIPQQAIQLMYSKLHREGSQIKAV